MKAKKRPYSTNGERVPEELWELRKQAHRKFLRACYLSTLSAKDWRNWMAQVMDVPIEKAHVRYFSEPMIKKLMVEFERKEASLEARGKWGHKNIKRFRRERKRKREAEKVARAVLSNASSG